MGIPLNLDFEMGVAKPIDSRFVMTKAQMLSVDDNVMPQVYGCWCTDDGKYYIYNKNNTTSLTTGKFVEQPDELSLRSIQSAIDAHNSYVESISELQRQVANIQDSLKANKEKYIVSGSVFTDGVWKHDFLPDHEKSYFCQKVEITYVGTYSETDADTIKVNGQSISLDNTHIVGVEETTNVKVVYENASLNVYCEDSLVGSLTDTIILTIEVDAPNISNESIDNVNCEYFFVDYSNVNIESKNGYPITENFEGEVIYWNVMPKALDSRLEADTGIYYTTLSTAHSKAVYSIGNYAGRGAYLFGVFYDDSNYTVSLARVIRYIYMANWDFSRITNMSKMFTIDQQTPVRDANPEAMKLFASKFDFTHAIVKQMTGKDDAARWSLVFPFCRYTRYCGSIAGMSVHFEGIDNNTRSYMYNDFYIKSYGDLSKWDMSNITEMSSYFSANYNLEFVGDIGEWNITNKTTKCSAIFSKCYNIKGISGKIANWDMSNNTVLGSFFNETFYLGDEVIKDLWKWNVGKVTTLNQLFAYGGGLSSFEKGLVEIPKGYERYIELKLQLSNEELTKAQFDAIAFELVDVIKSLIKKPKTDLSFIEKWNVVSAQRCNTLGAYNPYLVNVGDLRNWNCPNMNQNENGARNMFMFCTALETFKMPSFPRGTNVTDIVRGCISLANIEVDELNVEAISFEDSPLTKQSVLNLINAATDDVAITLKDDVYNLYYNDADVLSAIAEKAGDNIEVVLGTL